MIFENMVGLTFVKVENNDYEELIFTTDQGRTFKFYHEQDCCESVRIDDIVGDLQDLVGTPLLTAEEVSNEGFEDTYKEGYDDAHLWTFYKFATIKGYVDVRWLGTSNGYYSMGVDFYDSVNPYH